VSEVLPKQTEERLTEERLTERRLFDASANGLNVFDFNCMLGPTNTNREPAFRHASQLLREMDRVGISEALVYSSLARFAHPADGNRWLSDVLRNEPRLHACWVGLPPGNDELPEPEKLVEQMQAQNVRALRLLPVAHRFPVLEQTLRPLLKALSSANIPLLLDTDRGGWSEIGENWRGIFEIAGRHPELKLVLMREGGATARVLYPLWQEYSNIRLDASYIQESGIIEEIVARFGSDKLLFGSAMPKFDAGGPLANLLGAQISDGERAAVAGNNARELLGMQSQPPGEIAAWPCSAKGFRVFDVHGHIGRWEHKYYRDHTAEQMVARMDFLGIERFCVSDILAIGPDYSSGNTRVGKAVAQFPDRIIGYAVYNPNYESEMRAEMNRCFDELGCSGIKLHCALHDTATADPSYQLAWQIAHERKCPVLCHTLHSPSPQFFREMLTEYSECKFMYAHIGGGTKEMLEPLLEITRELPNFFLELSLSNLPRGVLAWLCEQVPVEQILYGSDHPLNEFAFQLGRVLYADIPDTTKQKILWDNAARIFNLNPK
jgi:predicted TIM-barrel fold metal-dependent hydrolase